MDRTEVNPCPFCGSVATVYSEGSGYHVQCNNQRGCSAIGPWVNDRDVSKAIAAWNQRTGEPVGDMRGWHKRWVELVGRAGNLALSMDPHLNKAGSEILRQTSAVERDFPLHPPEPSRETCCAKCSEVITRTHIPLCDTCAKVLLEPSREYHGIADLMEKLLALIQSQAADREARDREVVDKTIEWIINYWMGSATRLVDYDAILGGESE